MNGFIVQSLHLIFFAEISCLIIKAIHNRSLSFISGRIKKFKRGESHQAMSQPLLGVNLAIGFERKMNLASNLWSFDSQNN